MNVKIDINEELFERMKAKLSPSQIATALRMSINEGLTKGRTEVRRATQETYNLKASTINAALKITKATGNKLTGEIAASHKPISIKEADPKFKGVTIARKVTYKNGQAKAGAGIRRSVGKISVEVIKGQRKDFETAFVPGVATHSTSGQQFATSAIFARGKRGKPGFKFAKDRMPIDVISTVSPGTAATNKRSVEKYDEAVSTYARQRFIYHIERLIKSVDGLQ